MSEGQADYSGLDKVSEKRSEATSKEKPRWSLPENPGSQPAPANARETSLPLLPARESVPKQRQNPRSSAPPDFDMEVDEPGYESQQQPQARPQPHSGAQSEDDSACETGKPVERVEVDGHPGSEGDDQPDTQQSDDAHSTQPNGTEHDGTNGTPGQQVPPSGQETVAAEETVTDPKVPLEPYGWDDLERRFLKKMEDCQIREGEIEKDFREWINVFQAWASTTREHEQERAHKRLRTRMAWVQNSEQGLEEKRLHYIKVVQAFESALALLGGP